MTRFSIGDVVTLKSGGPAMTVAQNVLHEDGTMSVMAAHFNAALTLEVVELSPSMLLAVPDDVAVTIGAPSRFTALRGLEMAR